MERETEREVKGPSEGVYEREEGQSAGWGVC